MPTGLRQGGLYAILSGCFCLGRAAKKPIDLERLGLVLVAGGAVALMFDWLHSRAAEGVEGVTTVVGNRLDDMQEVITDQAGQIHHDLRAMENTAKAAGQAAVELGARIGGRRRTDREAATQTPDGKSGGDGAS